MFDSVINERGMCTLFYYYILMYKVTLLDPLCNRLSVNLNRLLQAVFFISEMKSSSRSKDKSDVRFEN